MSDLYSHTTTIKSGGGSQMDVALSVDDMGGPVGVKYIRLTVSGDTRSLLVSRAEALDLIHSIVKAIEVADSHGSQVYKPEMSNRVPM
jgi:hypothetical protein